MSTQISPKRSFIPGRLNPDGSAPARPVPVPPQDPPIEQSLRLARRVERVVLVGLLAVVSVMVIASLA